MNWSDNYHKLVLFNWIPRRNNYMKYSFEHWNCVLTKSAEQFFKEEEEEGKITQITLELCVWTTIIDFVYIFYGFHFVPNNFLFGMNIIGIYAALAYTHVVYTMRRTCSFKLWWMNKQIRIRLKVIMVYVCVWVTALLELLLIRIWTFWIDWWSLI